MAAVTKISSDTKPAVLWRGILLYLLPLPLLPAALFSLMDGDSIQALAQIAGFALVMSAATLIRKGIRLDNEARKRRLRRRASTVRYRMIGAVLVCTVPPLMLATAAMARCVEVGIARGIAVVILREARRRWPHPCYAMW